MDYQDIRTERRGGAEWIVIDRPDRMNAFRGRTCDELIHALQRAAWDREVGSIVLAGAGEKAFCTGGDQSAHAGQYDGRGTIGLPMEELHTAIRDAPKPVIARVHGDAYAGGVGLVAACDIAVAATGTGFCLSETRLGLIPATIGPYVLRAMGVSAARRYFLTAERFDASEALRIGLVHELVPTQELDARINGLLGTVMLTSANAVAESKRLVRELAARPIDDALVSDTAERIALIRTSGDGREGVRAFLEKRKPRWVTEHEAMIGQDGDDEEM